MAGPWPCGPNSGCENELGGFFCYCLFGFENDESTNCADIDECLEEPCDINGNCTNTPGSYYCTCNTDFYGDGWYCEKGM